MTLASPIPSHEWKLEGTFQSVIASSCWCIEVGNNLFEQILLSKEPHLAGVKGGWYRFPFTTPNLRAHRTDCISSGRFRRRIKDRAMGMVMQEWVPGLSGWMSSNLQPFTRALLSSDCSGWMDVELLGYLWSKWHITIIIIFVFFYLLGSLNLSCTVSEVSMDVLLNCNHRRLKDSMLVYQDVDVRRVIGWCRTR